MAGWNRDPGGRRARSPLNPVAAVEPRSVLNPDLPGRARAEGRPRLISDNSTPALQLSRVVELEIIPRLMLLHGTYPPPVLAGRQDFHLTAAHVETLAHLAVDEEAQRSAQFVSALLSAGASLDQVFLHLLPPAARLMGQLWEDDVYSFSQVTIGLWRLQQVLHEHSASFQAGARGWQGPRVMLGVPPGSTHTFGVSILSEYFARDGWNVCHEPQSSWRDFERALASEFFDVAGLSIGLDESVEEVASAIIRLRKASLNQGLFVMVGGPASLLVPDLKSACGADGTASDAPGAVALANEQVRELRRAS